MIYLIITLSGIVLLKIRKIEKNDNLKHNLKHNLKQFKRKYKESESLAFHVHKETVFQFHVIV